ncbi:MAG: type I-E CRISPR-associated protein Cas5/CasD [Rhodobacteraceae bacterium]|nr:type I-E CRISPR-associated protein Cas5/CasD [Paracoccaceae bacterium]
MAEHLVFTLAAALGSMGDVAGHERRGSWGWPGRSAILGLCAAAQGIRRDGDFAALDALSVAVAVFDAGQPLRDYHTVQTVPSAAARRPQSRPEALRRARGSLNTTITLRDYRAGVLYGVALSGPGLAGLKAALEAPVFSLYLGRKSCPLSAPLAPHLIDAPDAGSALAHLTLPPWWPLSGRMANTLIEEVGVGQGGRIERRHDTPLDRRKWHFAPREWRVLSVQIAPDKGVA